MRRLLDGVAGGAGQPLLMGSNGALLDAADARRLTLDGVAAGSPVALSVRDPFAFVQCLLALDGTAGALLLLSPELPATAVAGLMQAVGAGQLVTDRPELDGLAPVVSPGHGARGAEDTRWILTTSGTTGVPKMVEHRLEGLSRTVSTRAAEGGSAWGLLYDPSRFAGLQVVLQALMSGCPLVTADPTLPLGERLAFMASRGVTHLSATPTMWRKILMLAPPGLELRQITLGGEIADGAVLRALKRRWPGARISHIYASTEVGVGFSVIDGEPGFPLSYLSAGPKGAELKLVGDILWARPRGGAMPAGRHLEVDGDGYICTGDRVRIAGERVLFLGRESSLVNIGGTKVQPEALEQAAMEHPHVVGAQAVVRPSPITGNLLQLQVQAAEGAPPREELAAALKLFLKERLPRELQPMRVTFVDDLAVSAAGKLERRSAE